MGACRTSRVAFDHKNYFFRTMVLAVLALGVLAPLGAAGFCGSRAELVLDGQPLGGRPARRRTNPRSIWFGDVSQGLQELPQFTVAWRGLRQCPPKASNAQNIRPEGLEKCVLSCSTYAYFGLSKSLLARPLDSLAFPCHCF